MSKRTKGLVAAALAACAAGAVAVPAAQADGEGETCTYRVDVDSDSRLRIRDEPNTTSQIVGWFHDGAEFGSSTTEGVWVQNANGNWLSSDFLVRLSCTRAEEPAPVAQPQPLPQALPDPAADYSFDDNTD